jgi:hypothetical protein
MLEVDDLAVLDLCAWTGSQSEVARILNFNQSSVSRHLHKAKAILSSVSIECAGRCDYFLNDSYQIVKSQRRIHQLIRFKQSKGMRI